MSDSTIAAPLTMICGPTCGCGKGTPFIPDGHGTWLCPAACMHCGKSFGGSQWATGNPATVVTLTPFLFPDKAQLEIAELRSHVSTLTQARDEAIAELAKSESRYLSAVRGRQDFRAALKEARSALSEAATSEGEASRIPGLEALVLMQARDREQTEADLSSARSALQAAEKRITELEAARPVVSEKAEADYKRAMNETFGEGYVT